MLDVVDTDFTPTRATAQQRLAVFLPQAGRHYASHRNADFGPNDRSNVSALSPFIRHRLLLETEILDAVLSRFALSTAEKYVQEVFWRTYFKGYLEQRPSIWAAYQADLAAALEMVAEGGDLQHRYNVAVDGRTGIDCFDAWANELVETGYLHNHARMWFASIWIFTLDLPWQLGADFFLRHLMDGDPASNTLSWRWVGGLHTKGKTYLARPDNIERYTDGRFAPHGQLALSAPPLDEPHTHGKRPVPALSALGDAPYLLLITEEDCAPELLDLPRPPVGAIALRATDARSPLGAGARATAFAQGALEDAQRRAREAWRVTVEVPHGANDDWAGALLSAAHTHKVSHIVTAYAPVGPVADKLAMARAKLSDDGITVQQVRRAIDDIAWPHATRGFFGLKQKIPDILEDLQRHIAPTFL